ncbi:MAG: cell division protein FtsZ [Bacteroidia bacterium]|nr:cell division protein FtsZ [Bacteroidia bacterium]NNJ56055.1 cell division protein FtsZ [Bacteroidia bacterium]
MSFTVELPKDKSSIIKVVGVGGGGGNAVNHMYREGINGVDFFICNTDSQALESSPIPNKIQIGNELTEGRGAGSNPEVGRKAAEENIKDIIESLGVNTQMVFVTAGMGGGTGTGAAPVIAKAAKDMGILTVGIVTTPFSFEGNRRCDAAFHGIEEIRESVDSLLVISNDRIKDIYGNLPISKAFGYADNVLATAAKGIAEIITIAGSINVDFEDVKTAMRDSGVAIMGMGLSEGDDRAMRAVSQALNSPLLDDSKIQGASDLLVNISYGDEEATMDEYAVINEYLQNEAGSNATLKCGLCYDANMGRSISVTVIATGFDRAENRYKVSVESTEEIEFNLGDVEIGEEVGSEPVEAQKQTTIFDNLEGFEDMETLAANKKIEQMKTRMKYLRELNETANKETGMEELEGVPAYKRKGVRLDDVSHSSEVEISRTSLVEEPDKKPELRTNNSFLHDNVD